MLYAHFEGFWKAAFSIYLRAINSERVKCSDAIEQLVAASMNELFRALSDRNAKSSFFRRSAPDDSKLHRFARHAQFAGRISEAFQSVLNISIDEVVDTESNLTPVVVKKNLFRLGFAHDEFEEQERTINELLRRRNDISHGSARQGVSEACYTRLESSVVGVMKRVVVLIFESLVGERYRRSAAD